MIVVNDYEFEIEKVFWYPEMSLLVFTTEDDTVTAQIQAVKTETEAKIYAEGYKLEVKR